MALWQGLSFLKEDKQNNGTIKKTRDANIGVFTSRGSSTLDIHALACIVCQRLEVKAAILSFRLTHNVASFLQISSWTGRSLLSDENSIVLVHHADSRGWRNSESGYILERDRYYD